jgi:hypothetical protein
MDKIIYTCQGSVYSRHKKSDFRRFSYHALRLQVAGAGIQWAKAFN